MGTAPFYIMDLKIQIGTVIWLGILMSFSEKVNGGSISIGHPFGMTGSRQVGHVARELNRRGGKYGIVTMCVGGGMGATGLFEAYNS